MKQRPEVDFTSLMAPRRHQVLEEYIERRDTRPIPGAMARILYWLGVIPVETQPRYTGSVFARKG